MLLLFTQTLTMGTHYLLNADGTRYGIMTVTDIYHYRGFTFQSHRYLGPLKLKKDFDPASRMGRKFYKAFAEWDKLTPEQKIKTQING